MYYKRNINAEHISTTANKGIASGGKPYKLGALLPCTSVCSFCNHIINKSKQLVNILITDSTNVMILIGKKRVKEKQTGAVLGKIRKPY